MPLQEKNIKGFSVLELVVVLAIVATISVVAYPNFSEWNKERGVRSDVDKITALIRNTYTLKQREVLWHMFRFILTKQKKVYLLREED